MSTIYEKLAGEALTRLLSSGIKITENVKSWKEGYIQALIDLDMAKAVKTDRKNGKLIVTDFCYKSNSKFFTELVHHNKNDIVVTDGKYLLLTHSNETTEVPYCENMNGNQVDFIYPKYEKIIPDYKDTEKFSVDNSLKDKMKLANKLSTAKSMDKLYNIVVNFGTEDEKFIFTMAIVKQINKFLKVYPEATCYVRNDRLNSCLLLDEKSKDMFIFMPCSFSANISYTYTDGTFTEVK